MHLSTTKDLPCDFQHQSIMCSSRLQCSHLRRRLELDDPPQEQQDFASLHFSKSGESALTRASSDASGALFRLTLIMQQHSSYGDSRNI